MWDVGYGMWDIGYRIWDVGCGMWDMGCGIWDVGCGMWDIGYGMWDMGCGMWDVGCGIWVSLRRTRRTRGRVRNLQALISLPSLPPCLSACLPTCASSCTTTRDGLTLPFRQANTVFSCGMRKKSVSRNSPPFPPSLPPALLLLHWVRPASSR